MWDNGIPKLTPLRGLRQVEDDRKMRNKTLTAIIAGIIAGLLVLAIGYWLYWVRSQDILPMAAEDQVLPVLAQLSNENEWKSIKPDEIENEININHAVELSQEVSSSPASTITQVKGVSTDFKRPDCVVKEVSRPELGLSWRYQTCQNEQVSYRVDGRQVIEVVTTPEARMEQVVMELFEKPPSETMVETIEKKFISRLTEVAQIGCVPKISVKMTLTDLDKEVWEILPTGKYEQVANDMLTRLASAQPCGTYGYTSFLDYFEYHPKVTSSRYLFVQGNLEETYFDRNSIVFK